MITTTFETFRYTSRDTKEAIYIRHPDNAIRCLFLPKAGIINMTKGQKGLWTIEIPNHLAEEKDIF